MMEKKPVDILEAVAVELTCVACGSPYEITLRQVLLSQQMLHDGCPVPPSYTTECPPLYYADLVDHDLIRDLERIWHQIETSAQAAGGKLLLPGEDRPTG